MVLMLVAVVVVVVLSDAQWCTARYSLVNNINILLTGRGEERRDILGGREPDWDQPVVLSYFSIEFLCSRDKLLTGI